MQACNVTLSTPIIFSCIFGVIIADSQLLKCNKTRLKWCRGGSRKLFWEGHIGLESPKTTKRDAEGVEEEMSEHEVYPLPSRLGERHISSSSGVWGGAPATNILDITHAILCDFMHVLMHFGIQPARLTKPTRSDHLCKSLVWRGHVPPVSPVWIRP